MFTLAPPLPLAGAMLSAIELLCNRAHLLHTSSSFHFKGVSNRYWNTWRYRLPQCCFNFQCRMKTLVVFDFDHTLVDDNSDTWVIKCAPGQSLPDWLKKSYQEGYWTEYMGRVMSYLGDQAVSRDTVQSVMETVPFTNGMVELLTYISQNKKTIDCIIISDSNTIFIDWLLGAAGVKTAVDSVFTNPATFDDRGYMSVQCHHSHECGYCPVNLCKRRVLDDFVKSQTHGGIQYQRICYIGDGGNDLCPVKILREGDIVMPRKGYTLERLLSKISADASCLFKPRVVVWSSGFEILTEINTLFN